MAKNKEEKTNVVRILEAAGIPCTAYEVPLPKGPRGNTSCMSSPWPRPWI